MGRQQLVCRVEPSRFPDDFLERLERFREASGLSWRVWRGNSKSTSGW